MRISILFLVIIGLLLFQPRLSGAEAQGSDSAKTAAIEHLLLFIQNSHLIFIRNGEEHSCAEAAEHIRGKYERMKDKIKSPEDFIELAASKSTISGKDYLIKFQNGETKPSEEWLREELTRYRAGASH